MEHMLCWLWLTAEDRISRSKILRLLDDFDTVDDIYSAKSFNNIKYLTENDKMRLLNKDLMKARQIIEDTARLNAKIITFDDENYPQLLKHISDPPLVLYIQGKVPELDKVLTIGVVGTRRATKYGMLLTERFCHVLGREGVVTISGLAKGVDAAGAQAALQAGGMSVAVIGNGLDVVYPPENEELYKMLAERGCIMTEYAPGVQPDKTHFPMRNRIIAGISRGVLVTEAPKRSGALITARLAMESNRDVFAVPRDIRDTKHLGTNILIQRGAKLVNNPEDILCEYPYFERVTPLNTVKIKMKAPKEEKTSKRNFNNLSDGDRQIAEILLSQEMQVDELSRALNMPVSEVSRRTAMLEMQGVLKKLPGNRYQLKG